MHYKYHPNNSDTIIIFKNLTELSKHIGKTRKTTSKWITKNKICVEKVINRPNFKPTNSKYKLIYEGSNSKLFKTILRKTKCKYDGNEMYSKIGRCTKDVYWDLRDILQNEARQSENVKEGEEIFDLLIMDYRLKRN